MGGTEPVCDFIYHRFIIRRGQFDPSGTEPVPRPELLEMEDLAVGKKFDLAVIGPGRLP